MPAPTRPFRLRSMAALATALFVAGLAPALPVAAAGAVSQDFQTKDSLAIGSLVSLQTGDQQHVQAATSDNAKQLIGINTDSALVELGSGDKQVHVAVSGQTKALVSDINGDIKIGDKITASPIVGVGMKAVNSAQIVGTAESNLKSASTTAQTVTDKAGVRQQVHIGAIDVQVNVSYYVASENKLSAVVPTFLLNAGSAIAGKDVSPLRVLIGFTALLAGFVIAGIVLQTAIRSGIISLGRNPLAHTALRQSLVDVLITTVGLLVVTIIVFYLVLSA